MRLERVNSDEIWALVSLPQRWSGT